MRWTFTFPNVSYNFSFLSDSGSAGGFFGWRIKGGHAKVAEVIVKQLSIALHLSQEIPKSRDSSRENDDDSDTSEKKAIEDNQT